MIDDRVAFSAVYVEAQLLGVSMGVDVKLEFGESCDAAGWICWLDSHPGLASWAQAAGVVIALFSAILAAQIPVWHARRQVEATRRAAIQSAMHAATVIGGFFGSYIGDLEKHLAGEAGAHDPALELKAANHALNHFIEVATPLMSYPELAFPLWRVRMRLEAVKDALSSAKGSPSEATAKVRLARGKKSRQVAIEVLRFLDESYKRPGINWHDYQNKIERRAALRKRIFGWLRRGAPHSDQTARAQVAEVEPPDSPEDAG